MFADRTLAATGTATIFAGSILALATSQLTPVSAHPQFTLESVALLLISAAAAVLVVLRMFKALLLVIIACIAVFLQCLLSSLPIGMDVPAAAVGKGSISTFVFTQGVNNVITLFQHHLGWPVIGVGLVLIWRVAWGVQGRLFDSIRPDGPNVSPLSPRAAVILDELADTPKWPLLWGAGFILVGIIVLFGGEDTSLLRKILGALLTELGFAFFIAFVIILTIEIKSHAERAKQISRGILAYVYGADLDDEMFQLSEDYIFDTPFYRRDLEISYNFIRAAQGKLLLKYTISYDVKNVARNVKSYPVHTFVEKPAGGSAKSAAFPDITLGLQKIVIDGVELSGDQLNEARGRSADTDEYINSRHEIKIRPGQTRRVVGIHLLEKYERDAELWRSITPCSGVTLIVNWAEDIPLDLKAIAVHPTDSGDTETGGFDSRSSDATSLMATLFKPFFPYNGVYFWWDLRPEAEALKRARERLGHNQHPKQPSRVKRLVRRVLGRAG